MARSFHLTHRALLPALALTLCSPLALAQEAPAAPPGEAPVDAQEDDLELPAAPPAPPVGAPPATPQQPATAQAPAAAAPPQAAPAKPTPAAGKKSPEPSRAGAKTQAAAFPALRTGNLERTAHSRPVPLGLLFSGFIQGEYRRNQISEDQLQQDGLPLNRDQFVLRSARLRVDGGYEYTAYTLELDASTQHGSSVDIRRAEATLLYRGENRDRIPPLIGLSAGVTDLPFGYELVESSRQRLFLERTVASEALFPTQTDIGVKLFGAAGFLRYALAFVNGEPTDDQRFLPSDPNAAKDLVGRLGAEIPVADTFAVSGGASFSFGEGFHPEAVATKDTFYWDDIDGNNAVDPNDEIFARPGAAARSSENFERWAIGLDLQLQLRTPLGGTQLFVEGYVAQNHDRALFLADPVTTGSDVRHHAWYAGIAQEITRYGVAGFRAAYYDPNSDLLESRRGNVTPRSQSILTLSPVVGLVLPDRARLLAQYDFVRDKLGRDETGVPTDAKNNQLTLRLQVDL